jgi:uncharacterized protein (TIGR02217 family)
MTATYPNLIGLTFPVVKTLIMSVQKGIAASGREVRIALYANPIWEFTLTYDYAPDKWITSPLTSDLRTLMGFYAGQGGSLLPFQFLDPDDNSVIGQAIGEGDLLGTSQFTFVRSLGGSYGSITEPVGMLNTAQTLNVYVNGVLKTEGTDYTINTSTPVNNYVQFTSAPAPGAIITADFSYYFWVRFLDDQYDFSKFMSNLWEVKKIVLHSLRG